MGPCGDLEPQRKQGGAKETGTVKAWSRGGQSKLDVDATNASVCKGGSVMRGKLSIYYRTDKGHAAFVHGTGSVF